MPVSPRFDSAYEPPLQPNIIMKEERTNSNVTTLRDGKIIIHMDVHLFGPQDVTVKTLRDTIIVEGKHDERPDEYGVVERHFLRKFPLLKEHAGSQIQSTLSSDGILTITVLPPTKMETEAEKHHTVPILSTGSVHVVQ
jgi:crystallin, alpha B